MDNSFLVEEAYNQNPGEVQTIFTGSYFGKQRNGPDDRFWSGTLTQEWPLFSMRHQLSYSVPYIGIDHDGETETGLGDVLLSYRYQAYYDPESLLAVAPRASIVLPTGRTKLGFSDDTVGAQFNLPVSAVWGDRWATHFNAGLTWLPEALSAGSQDVLNYNLGVSGIYAVSTDLHFLVECTGTWLNVPAGGNGLTHEFVCLISPGFRYALNFSNDAQLVVGAAVPVGLSDAAPDIGVFVYISFEALFWKPKSH